MCCSTAAACSCCSIYSPSTGINNSKQKRDCRSCPSRGGGCSCWAGCSAVSCCCPATRWAARFWWLGWSLLDHREKYLLFHHHHHHHSTFVRLYYVLLLPPARTHFADVKKMSDKTASWWHGQHVVSVKQFDVAKLKYGISRGANSCFLAVISPSSFRLPVTLFSSRSGDVIHPQMIPFLYLYLTRTRTWALIFHNDSQ